MAESRLDRLERLSRLRESGALTQEEFEREKAMLDAAPAARESGGSGKALLLGSIAALALVAVGAACFLTQDRGQGVVREPAPQATVSPTEQTNEAPVISPPDQPAERVDAAGAASEAAPPSVSNAIAEPDLTGGFYDYRTRIRQGWQGRPNLADEFVVIRWGCGTGCTTGVVGNKRTGQLQWLELGGEDYPYLELRFDAGGNDVLAAWREDAYLCAVQMFQWNGRRMVAQEAPELHKTRTDDCSGVG